MSSPLNQRFPLESKRRLFFLIGLALSLILTILLFEMIKSPVAVAETEEAGKIYRATSDVIITVRAEEAVPERSDPAGADPEPVETYDPTEEINKKLKLPGELFPGGEEEGLTEIGEELPPEIPEPVSVAVVQHVAVPPGCEGLDDNDQRRECLNKWIQGYIHQHLRYPEQAIRIRLEDQVVVNFVISTTGEVERIKVVRGEHPVLNREAQRVLSEMPRWQPARQMGRSAPMSMTIPISFSVP